MKSRTNAACNEYREDVLSHHVPCGNLTKRPEVQKLLQKLGTIAHRRGAEDRLSPLAHARALRRRAARTLRAGQGEIHALHLAHPPLRRPRGASRAVSRSSHGPTHSLKETAEHISDTERNSADAERDSKDVKLFAFLKAQLRIRRTRRVSRAGD